MAYTVVRKHEIHCGHRVVGHEGKCANLHGHGYIFEFHCSAHSLDNIGRVIDFSVIKKTVCQWLEDHWDHRLLLWREDPWAQALSAIDKTIVMLPFNPTAENLGHYLLETIAPELLHPYNVNCHRVVVHETGNCWAISEQNLSR